MKPLCILTQSLYIVWFISGNEIHQSPTYVSVNNCIYFIYSLCTLKPGEKFSARSSESCDKKNLVLLVPYMTPYLMNHYLRKYLITIVCVLYCRRHHIFDVKTCFQQNRYALYVIVTSWVICFLYFLEFFPRYFDGFRRN
jgi:hypothetical protein